MKTQINNIKTGSPKTMGFIRSGKVTSWNDRAKIMNDLIAENGEKLKIRIGGKWEVECSLNSSLSGKTKWYSGDISLECFNNYSPYFNAPCTGENKCVIEISDLFMNRMILSNKRTTNSIWRERQWYPLSCAEIEIL